VGTRPGFVERYNAFTYCLIEAAQRSQIGVLLPCAMSNDYHAVIYDRCGRYPEFVEHFHKMLARSRNASPAAAAGSAGFDAPQATRAPETAGSQHPPYAPVMLGAHVWENAHTRG